MPKKRKNVKDPILRCASCGTGFKLREGYAFRLHELVMYKDKTGTHPALLNPMQELNYCKSCYRQIGIDRVSMQIHLIKDRIVPEAKGLIS
jgi:hypothetical protein